jgi:hypothetical protein
LDTYYTQLHFERMPDAECNADGCQAAACNGPATTFREEAVAGAESVSGFVVNQCEPRELALGVLCAL